MKKQFNKLTYFFNLLLIIIALCTNSCKKDRTTNDLQRSDQIISIAEAKNYFQQNFSEAKSAEILKNNPNPTPFQKIKKTVLWDEAKEYEISIGKAVRVPIYYANQLIYRAGKNQQAMDLYNLSYLMMYKDKRNKIHTEWVVALPDNDYVDKQQKIGTPFSGFIAIRDWYGNIVKGYDKSSNGTIRFLNSYSDSEQPANVLTTLSSNEEYCHTSRIVKMVPSGDSSVGYDFVFISTQTCFEIYHAGSPNIYENDYSNEGLYGETFPNDYVIGPCEECNKRDVFNEFTNPDADCIYNKLIKNATFNELIEKFKNDKNLNITFQNGNPVGNDGNPVAGQTHHDPGTTNFCITIDNGLIEGHGGIDIAKTFLHEAWHANLYVTAEKWYPNSLPSNFPNMSLVEQIKYLDKIGGNSIAQHTYMAENIDKIIIGLQEYVKTNFLDIYNNPANDYNAYKDLCMQGLQGTSVFVEYERQLKLNGMGIGKLSQFLITKTKCP